MEQEHTGSRKVRLTFLVIGILIALSLVGGAVVYVRQQNQKGFITSADPKLTDQEKAPYQQEIKDLRQKLDSSSKEDKYRYFLKIGADYAALGEYSKARDSYASASELFPDNSVPFGEMARISYKMEDYSRAADDIAKAIGLNPTNIDFQNLQKQINEALNK